MAESQANMTNFWAMTNPKFAAEQMRIQQQQALAQQMMEEGSKQPETAQLANPGGLVIPNSPLAAASKAGEKMLGAYMQKQNNDDLLKNYENLSPKALGAEMGGMGQGSQLSSVLMNDPAFAQNAAISGVDNATKVWLAQNSPTDLMKNASNSTTAPYVAKDQLINVNGHFQPASSLLPTVPQSQVGVAREIPPLQSSTPQRPAMVNGQPQAPANLDELLNSESSKQTNVMPNPIEGTTPKSVDFNNPIEVEAARKGAVDTAANSAEREKSYTKAQSSLQGFEQQTKIVTDTIDNALKTISPLSTGYGSFLKDLPNTDAGKLNNYLDTIKSNIGLDKLQNMRDNSPTGGALGQVSDMENKLLQATSGALDPKQTDQLKTNLTVIKELYPQVLAEKRRAFEQDYGGFKPLGSNPQPIQAPAATSAIRPPLSSFMK